MATMNRNVNLEEVNSDAFMGIPFLNHQSMLQKIVFWGSVLIAVAWNILATFRFHMNTIVVVFATFVPLIFGIAFGCNYNQDLSLNKYLILVLFKPCTVLRNKPTEDIEQFDLVSKRLQNEKEERERLKQTGNEEAHRKFLLKTIIGVVITIVIFVIMIAVILLSRTEEVHHEIDIFNYIQESEDMK